MAKSKSDLFLTELYLLSKDLPIEYKCFLLDYIKLLKEKNELENKLNQIPAKFFELLKSEVKK